MDIEILLLIITSVGGVLLGTYNAVIAARKGTLEEWRGLLAEQREMLEEQKKIIDNQKVVIEEQKVVIEEQKKEIAQRDRMIEDLKDWATRLVRQLAVHAPGVKAEEFIRRSPAF